MTDITVGVNQQNLDSAVELTTTVAKTLKDTLMQFGADNSDFALSFLRMDAIIHSWLMLLLGIIFGYIAVYILRYNAPFRNVEVINDRIRKVLKQSYDIRNSNDDTFILQYTASNSIQLQHLNDDDIEKVISKVNYSSFDNLFNEDRMAYVVLFAIFGALSIILAIVAIFSPWAFIGSFNPEMYAAHLAVAKIL